MNFLNAEQKASGNCYESAVTRNKSLPLQCGRILLLSLMGLLNAACGGNQPSDTNGGNQANSTSSASATNQSAPSTPSQSSSSSQPSEIRTNELVASDQFDFATKRSISLNINFSAKPSDTLTMLIYTDYAESSPSSAIQYLPSFRHLINQTRLQQQDNKLPIILPKTVNSLLVEIWRTEQSTPEQKIIAIDEQTVLTWNAW